MKKVKTTKAIPLVAVVDYSSADIFRRHLFTKRMKRVFDLGKKLTQKFERVANFAMLMLTRGPEQTFIRVEVRFGLNSCVV